MGPAAITGERDGEVAGKPKPPSFKLTAMGDKPVSSATAERRHTFRASSADWQRM